MSTASHFGPLSSSVRTNHPSRLQLSSLDRTAVAQERLLAPSKSWKAEEEEKTLDATVPQWKGDGDSGSYSSAHFGAQAVKHFKYGFLSAGKPLTNTFAAAIEKRLKERPGLMDATRSFTSGSSELSAVEARDLEDSDRRMAAGAGYGQFHPCYHRYFSQSRPPRDVEQDDEHPAMFPTSEVRFASSSGSARSAAELAHEKQEHTASVASGLGYGARHPHYYAYVHNSKGVKPAN
jgi:hypothetical protein